MPQEMRRFFLEMEKHFQQPKTIHDSVQMSVSENETTEGQRQACSQDEVSNEGVLGM